MSTPGEITPVVAPAVQGSGRRSARRVRPGVVRAVLFLAIVFGAPLILLRLLPGGADGSKLNEMAGELARSRPEYVFLGNSLLATRIDPDHLSALLGDASVISLAVDGSQSAAWYLQLKLVLEQVKPAPEAVFIFFHRDFVTRPLEGLGGENIRLVDDLGGRTDADFGHVLARARSFHLRTVAGLDSAYPALDKRADATGLIADIAALPLPSDRGDLGRRADEAFAFHNRRPLLQEPAQFRPDRPFASAVERSFLPLMLKVADEKGTELIFTRVAPNPGDGSRPLEHLSMQAYSEELGAYLRQRDAGYIDLGGKPAVDAAMYYDSYHIRQRFLPEFTELFLREAAPYFDWHPGPAAGSGQ